MSDARQQQESAMAERYETCVRIIHECSMFLPQEDVDHLCFECGIEYLDIMRAEERRVAELRNRNGELALRERPSAGEWF